MIGNKPTVEGGVLAVMAGVIGRGDVKTLRQLAATTETAESARTPQDGQTPFARLTPTQRKVLDGVYSGQLNKQIAYDLGIAEATVKAHMTLLMRKLEVQNRTQLAVTAQMLGWNPRALAH